MRYDSHSGLRLNFFRADGRPVRWVRWYDDQTHEWSAFRMDPSRAKSLGIPLESIAYSGQCPLVVKPAVGENRSPRQAAEPPKIVPATASFKPTPQRKPAVALPEGLIQECETHGCHKRATYYTNDVQEAEPVKGLDGNFYRTQRPTVRHYFCESCYRLPVKTSQRGVEAEIQVTAARPTWRSL